MAGNKPARRAMAAFTLIELLIVVAVLSVLMGMAIPSMLHTRMEANESSAISSLKVIASAMETYRVKAVGGTSTYPADYRDLGSLTPPEVDSLLASGAKSGYSFSGGGDASTYAINAVPQQFGISGRRAFYVDCTGVIRSSEDGNPAGPASAPIQ